MAGGMHADLQFLDSIGLLGLSSRFEDNGLEKMQP
jgi:hypothetical protein